jgi:hypothetical protein
MSKPKQTLEDLLNQIYEWRKRAITEIRMYDRKLEAQKRAANIFEQSSS